MHKYKHINRHINMNMNIYIYISGMFFFKINSQGRSQGSLSQGRQNWILKARFEKYAGSNPNDMETKSQLGN